MYILSNSKTVLASNLPDTDFQNCFGSKFASYEISRSQMNIDAPLLSICSFCNIWYRSLSNFYSATAKHTMIRKMDFSGRETSLHGESFCFATFQILILKSWSSLAFLLIKLTLMQESFAPQMASSGPLKNILSTKCLRQKQIFAALYILKF